MTHLSPTQWNFYNEHEIRIAGHKLRVFLYEIIRPNKIFNGRLIAIKRDASVLNVNFTYKYEFPSIPTTATRLQRM